MLFNAQFAIEFFQKYNKNCKQWKQISVVTEKIVTTLADITNITRALPWQGYQRTSVPGQHVLTSKYNLKDAKRETQLFSPKILCECLATSWDWKRDLWIGSEIEDLW